MILLRHIYINCNIGLDVISSVIFTSHKKTAYNNMATETVPEAFSAAVQKFDNAPPFPDNVPTAPLLRLSLVKLLQRDNEEVNRFVRACEDLGFFYLDLSGPGDSLLADADQLFKVGAALYDLPLEEKKKYDFMHKNSYFGYKGYGANVVDRDGNLDRNEFYNVSTCRLGVSLGGNLRSSRYQRTIYWGCQSHGQHQMCSALNAHFLNHLSNLPMGLSALSLSC